MLGRIFAALVVMHAICTPAQAGPVRFDESWKEQGFLRLFTNDYTLEGARLGVVSEGTVSLLWRALAPEFGDAKAARWAWSVRETVVSTDLTLKGGDDRNLALYFVFASPDLAKTLASRSPRKVLDHPDTRAIIYVWGGSRAPGTILRSPYSEKLRTKILRPAEAGSYREQVDLAADFQRAFGSEPGVLIAVAVSADSDDSDGRIEGEIRDLELD